MLPVQVYEPDSQLLKPGKLIKDIFQGFLDGRFLAWRLFIRNISAMYRQSVLGLAWAFLPPLVTALFWIFLKSQQVFSVAETAIPYVIFVFTGTILWQIFLDALNTPLKVVQQSRAMLVKINFPREAILLSSVYEVIFNALIKLVILGIVYLWFGYALDLESLMGILGILSMIFLGISLSLILIPFGLLYGDIQRGIAIITQFLFFLTPIIYPIPTSGKISLIIRLNPVSTFLEVTRNWITLGVSDTSNDFWIILGLMILLMITGLILFRLSLPHLIERIGA